VLHLEFWYGQQQRFGQLGKPQRWINILGTAHKAVSLSYKLNGGEAMPLSLGTDTFPLAEPGDFNAEIACDALLEGQNILEFTATDALGNSVTELVHVDYTSNNVWPRSYSIDWSQVSNILDVVQVVDGRWQLSKEGIRPTLPYYDRLVALGDMSWRDYKITLEATLHTFFIDPSHPWADSGLEGGFGLLFRWSGHYPDEYQPYREWRPNGAIGWYRARWEEKPAKVRCLNISDAVVQDRVRVETPPLELALEKPYLFEFSVQSQGNATSLYTYRIWAKDNPNELRCDLSCFGKEGEAATGSILLVSLFADLTIGTGQPQSRSLVVKVPVNTFGSKVTMRCFSGNVQTF
jgi:hypothetical protein